MWFEQLMFFVGAFGALGGAVGLIMLRNPFYSVLALVMHLLSLALLFLLLRAEFLAASQVVVYVGAVMVLYIFVVAYVGGVEEAMGGGRQALRTLGPLFAIAVLVELSLAIIGSGLTALDSPGPHVAPGFGTPGEIGRLLLERFLLPFEAASFLLLVAAVGALVLSGRKRGLEGLDPDTLPERAGMAPMPGVDIRGGGGAIPGEDKPTRVPGGTAEGPDDPAVTEEPDHEVQEDEPEVPEKEPVT
jgi:NADH:ubiquinone oxidoreductase subunit 6 (subunit J)